MNQAQDVAVMAAPAESLGRRMLDYIDWRVNPILVKDLRLWMRGRGFILQYFLLIALIVIGSAIYTVAARTAHFDGQILWGFLFGGAALICGAIVPNLVYERFRQELKNRATELVLLSELSARRLVRGKLFSAWCASMLVLSAAAPAFATAYLLGGLDFFHALFSLMCLLAVTLLMPCVQLMLATMGVNAPVRLLAGIVALAQIIFSVQLAIGLHAGFFSRLAGSGPELWVVGGVTILVAAFSANYFYQVAVSKLQMVSENREFAPRLSLLLVVVASGCCVWASDFLTGGALGSRTVYAGSTTMSILFSIGFLFICGTTYELPERLRAGWPRLGLIRLVLYPGLDRLCSYVLLAFLLIMALPLFHSWMENDWEVERLALVLVPYILIGGGLAFQRFVMTFIGDRTGWWPTELATMVGMNVAIAVFSAIVTISCYAAGMSGASTNFALALSPINSFGLAVGIVSGFQGNSQDVVLNVWFVEAGVVTFFLLLAALSGLREGWSFAAAGKQNSRYRVVK